MNQIEMIPVEQILPHPENPRKELGDLTELTESIRANGILQNLTVVSADQVAFLRVPDPQKVWYAAVIGHRRLAAAKAAGLEAVPCVVAGMDRKTQLTTMLMENVQRSDLTVYEQAQGFHQLALLGCPVAEISRRSGFSGTTVRRRLKLAQLDQGKLKAASGRQISMQDYELLLQLKTKEEQDRALDVIGTRDFRSEVERARIREAAAERMPELTAWLETHGATQITRSESWTSKYEGLSDSFGRFFSTLRVDKLGEPGGMLPSDDVIGGRKLFYTMDATTFSLYVRTEKKAKEKKQEKDPKVVEQDRRIREAWNRLEELQSFYQDQHMFFLEERICAAKQPEKLLNGALYVMVGRHFFGFYQDGREIIEKAMDIGETKAYSKERQELVLKRLKNCGEIRAPELIYGFFGALNFAASSKAEWPKPCVKEREQLRYRWLRELGYEVSTEEETLLDGTHEVFRGRTG